ncbi:uncharacterized protein Dmul_13510 [Desulfococcus multivorans]|nr:uncharacterized protein Dmul_13510 [Desulfococcus multivorans]
MLFKPQRRHPEGIGVVDRPWQTQECAPSLSTIHRQDIGSPGDPVTFVIRRLSVKGGMLDAHGIQPTDSGFWIVTSGCEGRCYDSFRLSESRPQTRHDIHSTFDFHKLVPGGYGPRPARFRSGHHHESRQLKYSYACDRMTMNG